MITKLQKELELHKIHYTPTQFKQIVEDTFNKLFPNVSDDAMLYQPTLAIQFDNEVRAQLGIAVPDELINRTLVNIRKRAKSQHKRDL